MSLEAASSVPKFDNLKPRFKLSPGINEKGVIPVISANKSMSAVISTCVYAVLLFSLLSVISLFASHLPTIYHVPAFIPDGIVKVFPVVLLLPGLILPKLYSPKYSSM